jgi:hypothetical protein
VAAEEASREVKGDYPKFWPRSMQKERRRVEAKRVLEWVEKRDRYVLRQGRDHAIDFRDGRCTGTVPL